MRSSWIMKDQEANGLPWRPEKPPENRGDKVNKDERMQEGLATRVEIRRNLRAVGTDSWSCYSLGEEWWGENWEEM